MIFGIDNREPAWQVAQRDPEKYRHTLPVAKIVNLKTGASGTAFRVDNKNAMMTNAHVLSTGDAKDYRIEFTDSDGRQIHVPGDKVLAVSSRPGMRLSNRFHPDTYQGVKQGLDFSLFTIKANPSFLNKKFGHLSLEPAGAQRGEQIYIPQYSVRSYPNDSRTPKTVVTQDDFGSRGGASRISNVYQANQLHNGILNQSVHFTADTLPGSSGAPVISADSHKVIALNNGRNWKNTNAATNMADIWKQIRKFFQPERKTAVNNTSVQGEMKAKGFQDSSRIGSRTFIKGIEYESWATSDKEKPVWLEVWRDKFYPTGAVVIHNGVAYQNVQREHNGTPVWTMFVNQDWLVNGPTAPS